MAWFDISLETANRFYAWGWKASILGATITLIGVLLLMWGTRIRDGDNERQLANLNLAASQAQLKSSELDQQTSDANKAAALANERAAILEKEAAEARLELGKIRTAMHWRALTDDQRSALISNLKGKSIEIFVRPVAENIEADEYAKELVEALAQAGCKSSLGSLVPSINSPGLSIAGPDGGDKTAIRAAFKAARILLQTWDPPKDVRQADIQQLTIIVGAAFKPL